MKSRGEGQHAGPDLSRTLRPALEAAERWMWRAAAADAGAQAEAEAEQAKRTAAKRIGNGKAKDDCVSSQSLSYQDQEQCRSVSDMQKQENRKQVRILL